MRLRELSIGRLPGIEAIVHLSADDIGPHVTLIHGPNSAGKTSLCRAVRALLWPDLEPSRAVDLRATFELDAHALTVERHADHVTWSVDGESAPAPHLPPRHLASCYTIDGDDLVARADAATLAARDESLAAEIARQMAGGFDLRALHDEHDGVARSGQHEAGLLRAARLDLKRAQDEHRALDRERAQLGPLTDRVRAVDEAKQSLPALDTALELCTVREEISALESQSVTFPSGMEALFGDERERLATIDQKIADERARAAQCADEIARCHASLRANALPEAGLAVGTLEELRQRLRRLEQREMEMARLALEEGGAADELEQRRKSLHPARIPRTDPEALAHVEAFLQRSEMLSRERADLAVELERHSGDEPEGTSESCAAGARHLTQWLSTPHDTSRSAELARWLLLVLVALGSIVLAVKLHPGWLALVVVAAAVEFMLRARAQRVRSERTAHQDDYARLDLAPPMSWTRAAVEARVEELMVERAALELAREERARRALFERKQAELDERAESLQRERAAIGETFGLELSTSDLSLSILARHVIAYEQARLECVERGARLERSRRELELGVAELSSMIEALGVPGGSEAAMLSGAITTLAERAAAHTRERIKLESASSRGVEAERMLGELGRERAQLCAGLNGDDRADIEEHDLLQRLERLPEWKKTQSRLTGARARQHDLVHKLASRPEYASLARHECAAARDHARATAAEHDELIRRIQDIQTRVAELEKQHGLEEAMARADEAMETLREKRELCLDAAAALWLVERIEEESQATAQSPVFRRAAAWFAKFTHHAFELELAPGRAGALPAFRALDTTAHKKRALSELSSGTRAQLLLAARIAFATESERGVVLPIFLDDALSTSDPERFIQIAASLSLLAREEDRQIFYLTSDPLDVARWRESAPGHDVRVIDLAAVREMQTGARTQALVRPEVEPLPAPDGYRAAEYARAIGVPRIDPHANVESLHLYYLLEDDLALLHRLLTVRVDTLGKLRSLARARDWQAYLSTLELQRVESWAAVYEEALRAWHVGRGAPLTQSALESAGVSEKFRPVICEIATEVASDAKRLIKILELRSDPRLKNWRELKTAEMEYYLEAEGFFDRRDPLGEQEVHVRVLSAAARDVASGVLAPTDVVQRTSWWLALFSGTHEHDTAETRVVPAEPTTAHIT